MSIALNTRIKELERRIAELEDRKADPALMTEFAAAIERQMAVAIARLEAHFEQKRKPGRPPKNG